VFVFVCVRVRACTFSILVTNKRIHFIGVVTMSNIIDLGLLSYCKTLNFRCI